MKLCSRLLVLYCRDCLKDHKFRYLIPMVDGSLESLCRLLIICNRTSFSISYHWRATRQNMSKLTAFWTGVVHFEPRFPGEGVVPGNIFWFLRNWTHFAIWQCKLHHAMCSSFDTILACDRQTDGWMDGIADIASTALAMRAVALQRAVKMKARFGCLVQHPAWKWTVLILTVEGFHEATMSHLILDPLFHSWSIVFSFCSISTEIFHVSPG